MSDPNPSNVPTKEILDHNYDGIQEYDNPTPFWWNALFVGSIIFAPIYVLWFHSPYAENTHAARYESALAENLRLQFGELGDLQADEETLLRFMGDPEWEQVGQATFKTHCAPCHGKQGEGVSAPNLTDDYYLHVKQVTDIATVIKQGAKAGAMPAWEQRLHPTELVLTAAYVASLRGENLPTQRKAEGNEIDPWPAAPAAESEASPAAE